jgi:flagellar motility protein MotE (MotC chaperone)
MRWLHSVLAAAAIMGVFGSVSVDAEEAKTAPVPAAAAAAADPSPADNATLYCRNIANAAADARYTRQADALALMNKELSDRIDALEQKRAEYEAWVKRREDFLKKADESVVAIYSQMRPDAAAKQIAVMDEEAAAAILSKLTPRTASAILNEMDAAVAAHLTNVMAGLAASRGKVTKL